MSIKSVMKSGLLTVLLTLIFYAQADPRWESIVLDHNVFKYLVPDADPPSDWMMPEFNDASWPSGRGGFGYADNDDNTLLPEGTPSIYLRKEINLPEGVILEGLVLDIDYDDAFVAYINGQEVARSNNINAEFPSREGNVTDDHEAQLYSGGLPDRFVLDKEALNTGRNVLSVHILNNPGFWFFSDMTGRVFLHAKVDAQSTIFQETPSWFEDPILYETSVLPIIKINTQGQAIIDEPKIMVEMQVINNPQGLNHFDDTTNYEYDGFAGIEIRGFTSQQFPKKGYGLETRLSNGENNNVSLFGMPEENDWVLHGPYSDKSLMRNALAYHLGARMSDGWQPRIQFVELAINGQYQGVYLFTEKIKIDDGRVDIANLTPEDVSGDQLTGGYIISIDRDQEGSWNSPFMGRTGSVDVPFSYVDPGYDELQPEQRAYIREYVTDFEYALNGENYRDPELGYRPYVDVMSFVDLFLMTELARDLDGYRVSVFFHKDKDSKGGRLNMTPFWDFNICFGNANFFEAGNPEGWAAEGIGRGDSYEVPFWWDRLRTDPYFESMLKYRWEQLRAGTFSKDSINAYIDHTADLLSNAQKRNFQKWNVLNTNVWPNNYVGGTYENEINYLKTWLSDRIDWLDAQFNRMDGMNFKSPSVATTSAENIANTTALLTGIVINDGNADVWNRGFYWSQSPNPEVIGEKIRLGIGDNSFSTTLDDLEPNTTYYFRAYAENDIGISIGDVQSFTTTGPLGLAKPNSANAMVYPNPFTDSFTFEVVAAGQTVSIAVLNVMGQVVEQRQQVCSGNCKIYFDSPSLQNGNQLLFYSVKIGNAQAQTGKLIRK